MFFTVPEREPLVPAQAMHEASAPMAQAATNLLFDLIALACLRSTDPVSVLRMATLYGYARRLGRNLVTYCDLPANVGCRRRWVGYSAARLAISPSPSAVASSRMLAMLSSLSVEPGSLADARGACSIRC